MGLLRMSPAAFLPETSAWDLMGRPCTNDSGASNTNTASLGLRLELRHTAAFRRLRFDR